MRSLEKQLGYTLTLTLAGLFVVFWWVTTYTIHELTERYIVTRLEHDSDTLLRHLKLEDGQWHLSENAAEAIYLRPHSGHYYLIKSRPPSRIANLLSPSLDGFSLYTPITENQSSVYETNMPDSSHTLVLRVPFERDGEYGYLFVAEDHSPIQNSLRTFDVLFALFSLMGLLVLLWSQRRILKRGFDSLNPVKQALNEIQSGKQVAIQAEVPQEIAPLVETLNQAMSQLHARLERSRMATGNLAHALKSPLNLIYQFLEDERIKAHPQLQGSLQEQAERILNLIDRELSQARMAGSGVALQAFQFPQDLQDLINTMRQLYRDKAIEFEMDCQIEDSLPFDREDLFELLGNLLDNACKWCQSRVRISVETEQAWLVIHIEDDGQGVAQKDIDLMKNRGIRLDESQPGHGLGLSIVHEIVKAYDGQIAFTQKQSFQTHQPPLSGLQVTIRLPLHTSKG